MNNAGGDLLPCPFCGGQVQEFDQTLRGGHEPGEPDAYAYAVRCLGCAATGPWFKTVGNARRLWNTRAASAAQTGTTRTRRPG